MIKESKREHKKLRSDFKKGKGIHRNARKISRGIKYPLVFAGSFIALKLFDIFDVLTLVIYPLFPQLESAVAEANLIVHSSIIAITGGAFGLPSAAIMKGVEWVSSNVLKKTISTPLQKLQSHLGSQNILDTEYYDFGKIKDKSGNVGVMALVNGELFITYSTSSSVPEALSVSSVSARGTFNNKIKLYTNTTGVTYELKVPMGTARYWKRRIKKALDIK